MRKYGSHIANCYSIFQFFFHQPIIIFSKNSFRNTISWIKIRHFVRPGPEVIKLFSCSTQLSTKFIMLINVKMPTIVGILTFISMLNATSESLKARKVGIFLLFSFYEQLKFHTQLS